jgi:hypothetical protein
MKHNALQTWLVPGIEMGTAPSAFNWYTGWTVPDASYMNPFMPGTPIAWDSYAYDTAAASALMPGYDAPSSPLPGEGGVVVSQQQESAAGGSAPPDQRRPALASAGLAMTFWFRSEAELVAAASRDAGRRDADSSPTGDPISLSAEQGLAQLMLSMLQVSCQGC